MSVITRSGNNLQKTLVTPEKFGILAVANKLYHSSGYANIADFLAEVGSDECTLLLDNPFTVSADATIPSTIGVISIRTGKFVIASGKTLTINGSFEAGLYQVFSGTGGVVFGANSIRFYEPIWFNNTSQPPVANTFPVGVITKNIAPIIGQPKGWVCTVAGAPGTWVSEGNL